MARPDPRVVFAERLNLLWAEAGKPIYDKLARDAQQRVVADPDTGRLPTVSKQRISDWKNGSQIPREFTGVSAVVAVLIGEARRRRPTPVIDGLYSSSEWRLWWHQAVAATEQGRRGDTSGTGSNKTARPAGEDDGPDQICPYRGLAAFGAQHSDFFFGREDATDDLVDRVNELCATGELLMLVAPSGAGKSSVLGAGLIPAIRSGGLAIGGAADWPIIGMAPGPTPNVALAEHVPALAGLTSGSDDRPVPQVHDDDKWSTGVRAAISELARARSGAGARVVLVIDQFEELFTLCDDETERQRFINTLHAAARGPDSPALVILGMRADFYSRCLEYPPLVEALQHRHMVLAPMTTKELREAITGPASAAGLRLESHLDDQLIQDAGIRFGPRVRTDSAVPSGTLPLLSHALRATWQRRQNGRLTITGYKSTGGIHGAVTQTAERALGDLSTTGQAAAMNLLLRLVRVGEDHTQDTRRRCDTHQLIDQAYDRSATAQALEAFVQARLVTVDTDTAQITHEALLHVWPRLRRQTDDHRAALLGLQRLEDDAQNWAARDRDPSRLYRGDQLTDTQQWAHRGQLDGPGVTGIAREFLDQASAARDRDDAQRARRVARDRRIRTVIAVLAAFGIMVAGVAIVAGVRASHREDDANFATVLAQADRLQASDPSLAAQLDLVAQRMRPDDPDVAGRVLSTQNAALATSLPGSGNAAIDYTGISPDGHTLATASNGVQLWDLTNRGHPTSLGPPLHADASYVATAAFSPDGRTLASTGGDGVLRLWDVSDRVNPKSLAQVPENHGASSLLAFSPDGHTVATANSDGDVVLWDIRDPAHPTAIGAPLTGHTAIVRSVAFSRDAHLLAASGDDKSVLLWDIRDPNHPVRLGAPIVGHSEAVRTVAFSPDGHLLASAGDDKTARLWDITDPAHPSAAGDALVGHKGSIWSVAFAPDGRTLATGSQDGTAKLWNISTPASATQIGADLATRTGGIFALAYSPDGQQLFTGGDDGTTLLWTLPTTVLAGPTSRIYSVAFSPDGHTLAVGSHDHSIWLWNLTDPQHPTPLGQPLLGHNGIVTRVAFSPDGHTLASESGDDRTVRLWDLTHPTQPTPIGPPIARHTQYEGALAFSHNGALLATSDTDNTVQLWRVDPTSRLTPVGRPLTGHTDYLAAVGFSPDDRTLATASFDGTVRLWNITDPAQPVAIGPPLNPHSGKVRDAEFSPDGRTLATTGEDKTLKLWALADLSHPVLEGAPLTGHGAALYAVAYASHSDILASASADKSVRLWGLPDDPRSSEPLTGHTGRVVTVAFSPDDRLLASGSDDDTARLWDLNVDDSRRRICATTQGTLSAEQWGVLLPTLSYTPPC